MTLNFLVLHCVLLMLKTKKTVSFLFLRLEADLFCASKPSSRCHQAFVKVGFHGNENILHKLGTLVYRIDVQYEINMQVGKFLKTH